MKEFFVVLNRIDVGLKENKEMLCTHPRRRKSNALKEDGEGKNFIHQFEGGWGRVWDGKKVEKAQEGFQSELNGNLIELYSHIDILIMLLLSYIVNL